MGKNGRFTPVSEQFFPFFHPSGCPETQFFPFSTRRGAPKRSFSQFSPVGVPRNTVFDVILHFVGRRQAVFAVFFVSSADDARFFPFSDKKMQFFDSRSQKQVPTQPDCQAKPKTIAPTHKTLKPPKVSLPKSRENSTKTSHKPNFPTTKHPLHLHLSPYSTSPPTP